MAIIFRKKTTGTIVDLTQYSFRLGDHEFTVENDGSNHVLLQIWEKPWLRLSERVIHVEPYGSHDLTITIINDTPATRTLRYYLTETATPVPFVDDDYRYNPHRKGKNSRIIPIDATIHASYKPQAAGIINLAKATTSNITPSGTIYTPGGPYTYAGIFARDYLYTLEGASFDFVTRQEAKYAIDMYLASQATSPVLFAGYTSPAGSVPDHISPENGASWTPGWSDATWHRPSLDEHFCIITAAWYAGYKANWDGPWSDWFTASVAAKLEAAYSAVPFNNLTGLHCQWISGPAASWGFLDSEMLQGDIPGLSVLAYNACNALADMYRKAENTAKETEWADRAAALQAAVQAVFKTGTKTLNGVETAYGYLTWTTGSADSTNPNGTQYSNIFSPDITGYAIWSGILTDEQCRLASDWIAAVYNTDKVTAGKGQLFCLAAGYRGPVREAMRMDDFVPGIHVWQNFFNLGYGYDHYQDGGYWYYNTGWVYTALWYNHQNLAVELLANCLTDLVAFGPAAPYERIDYVGSPIPGNPYYTCSAAPLYGIGIPATTVDVTVQVVNIKFGVDSTIYQPNGPTVDLTGSVFPGTVLTVTAPGITAGEVAYTDTGAWSCRLQGISPLIVYTVQVTDGINTLTVQVTGAGITVAPHGIYYSAPCLLSGTCFDGMEIAITSPLGVPSAVAINRDTVPNTWEASLLPSVGDNTFDISAAYDGVVVYRTSTSITYTGDDLPALTLPPEVLTHANQAQIAGVCNVATSAIKAFVGDSDSYTTIIPTGGSFSFPVHFLLEGISTVTFIGYNSRGDSTEAVVQVNFTRVPASQIKDAVIYRLTPQGLRPVQLVKRIGNSLLRLKVKAGV